MQIDKHQIVKAIEPQAGASIEGDYISLKNVVRCHVVVFIAQASATQVAITIEQCASVTAPNTGSTPITNVVPIWSNIDCASSNTLVPRTAAVSYTTDVGQLIKMVVFEINPEILDAGYDCISVFTATSDASNVTAAWYECEMRYSGADVIGN